MVAGMTPTTVKAGFVSAVLRAGFHIELAGGGHYNANALRAKVTEIQAQIPPGVGLTLNSLYINPRQFGFQLPLWQELRREGVPVEGFCVAAGIPSSEKASEIISGLKSAGIRHVSFKPGSVEGIRQVVNIAIANPDFPIILQWTGGRAGGHHSCEDFHQPLLQTYAAIRQQSNICLVGGSGFGGSDDVWPYLTGQWSVDLFGVQPMPFDGFLFASRVMVAKEAHTSESVKQLIVAAPGVDDKDWEGSYTKETGGILTVNSELGEPIHKIATRGVKLWKEFDDTVFKLPKDKRAAWLAQNKKSVIEKLNRDFAKPWFAQKKDGTVVDAIGEMTYEEVVLRMIRLMYVSHQQRWIDLSLRNLTGDFCRRVEERFAGEMRPSILQSFLELDDPIEFVKKFFKTYPAACEQLVASEDAAYFLAIAQRPGQKPVPFIPVLDADFSLWFKKAGLFYTSASTQCSNCISLHRTRCGLLRTLKPFLTKILSVFASFRVLSPSDTPPRPMNPSKNYSETLKRTSGAGSSKLIMMAMSRRSLWLTISVDQLPRLLLSAQVSRPPRTTALPSTRSAQPFPLSMPGFSALQPRLMAGSRLCSLSLPLFRERVTSTARSADYLLLVRARKQWSTHLRTPSPCTVLDVHLDRIPKISKQSMLNSMQ